MKALGIKAFLAVFVLALCCAPARAQEAQDPCVLSPAPEGGDLAQVQADIDRLTLCIERAELIKELNKLVSENTGSVQVPPISPGMILDEGGPTFENYEQPAPERTEVQAPPPSAEQPAATSSWSILEIFGGAENLRARISNKESGVVQVKAGDTLAGGVKVTRITPTRVILSEDGKETELDWVE